MIISHSRRFIFVHIHKAGGTSVEQALDPYLAWNDLILGGSPFGERIQEAFRKRFGLSKHSTVSEIETICGSRYLEEYFVFALVRHPLARLCSLYNFVGTTVNNWAVRHNTSLEEVHRLITPQSAKTMPGMAWLATRIFLKTSGFSEFIRHKDIKQAQGFRTQASILSRESDGKIVGEFFRLEDRLDWEPRLADRLGFDFRLLHANPSGVRLVEASSVSSEDKAFIEDQFEADYEAFGYAP